MNLSMRNKKILYVGLGVVLVGAISYMVVKKTNLLGGDSGAPVQTVDTTTPESAAATQKKPSSGAVSVPATQKYLDAIKIYKTVGYYFQFVDCHGSPGTLTLKAGKKFMLDNRDAKSRKIAIQGGQSFQIGPYDFAIATAPSALGLHYITCDGGGAASITVQK